MAQNRVVLRSVKKESPYPSCPACKANTGRQAGGRRHATTTVSLGCVRGGGRRLGRADLGIALDVGNVLEERDDDGEHEHEADGKNQRPRERHHGGAHR